MKLWLKILSVVVITFCFGSRVMSGEVTLAQDVDATAECPVPVRLNGRFTLGDLTKAYNFIGSSFILPGQIDLSGDTSTDKEKKVGFLKSFSYQDSVLKSLHVIRLEKFRDYLFKKHVQGSYIHWIDRLVI